MKKFFSLAVVLALVCMAGTSFAADFTSSTKTAVASFTGGEVAFSANFYQWEGTYEVKTPAENITWNTSGITLGSSTKQWKNSEVYCLVTSAITSASGEVYIYTDNKNNTDSKYIATSSESGYYSGLVRENSGGGAPQNFADLQCFYCKLSDAKTTYNTAQPVINGGSAYGTRNLADKGSTDVTWPYVPADNIVSNRNGNFIGIGEGGVKHYINEDIVIFFGAGFTNAIGGESFGTNTVTFKSNVE
jgi:hypothetical protein